MFAAAVLSAAGAVMQGVASAQAARYQAAIAKANAQAARQNAGLALEIGQRDAIDIATESRGLLGEQIASQAGSGISLSSPSFITSRARARELGYEDQLRRIEASSREAARYRTQANVSDAEAASYRSQAGFSLLGGFLGAATSLVSAAPATSFGTFNSARSYQSPSFLGVPTLRPRIGSSYAEPYRGPR